MQKHTLSLRRLTCRTEVAGLLMRFITDRKITIASYIIHACGRERIRQRSIVKGQKMYQCVIALLESVYNGDQFMYAFDARKLIEL